MRSRHIVVLAGLTVASVFGIAVLWEFLLEDALHALADPGYVAESAAEHWHYVAVAVGVSLVSLIAPIGLIRRLAARHTIDQRALAESRERLNTILENPDWVWEIDAAARYSYASSRIRDLLGYEPGEVIGKTAFDLMEPEEARRVAAEFAAIVAERRPFSLMENVNLHRDGRRVIMETSGIPLFDECGIFSGYRGIDRDITERKTMQRALAESEERYRTAFRTSPDSINLNRLEDGLYLDLNDGFTEITGFTREDVIGRTSAEIGIWADPGDRKRLVAGLKRDGRVTNLEAQFRRKDGSLLSGLMSARILTLDGVPTIMTITRDISAIKRAEEALRESEGRLRALMEGTSVGIGVEDLEGRTIEPNPGLARTLGYTPEEFQALRFTDYTHPDDDAIDARLFKELAAGKRKSYQMEKRYVRKDGQIVWGRLTRSLFTDAEGRPRYCMGMMEDITERKRAEEELRRSRERFAKVFQAGPSLMAITSVEDGRLYEVNEKYLSVLGFSRDEVIGRTSTELGLWLDPTERARFVETFKRDGVVHEVDVRIPTKTGEMRDFLLGWERLDLAGETAILGVLRDVTERKRTETALAASERRLDLALRATNDGLWDWDLATDETFYSDRYKSILGYGPNEFPATHQAFLERLHPDDRERVTAAIERFKTGPGERYEEEFRMLHRDGRVLDIRSRGYLVRDAAGKPARATGTHTDVTELRAVQAQLIHAQKLQVVGQLAGGTAHDFNNLLQVVQSSLDVARTKIAADDPVQRFLDNAVKATQRGGHLTQQLLSFSRTQLLRPETLSPATLIHGMLDLIRHVLGEDIDIEAGLEADLPPITVDPHALENAILNIAVNARAAMPRGGRLAVRAGRRHLEESQDAADGRLPAGAYVEIALSDTGCGMPPEVLERAFEPFFTTKEVGEGSGLGLSMVYGFARQSGGRATIDSEPGKGTTVKILLPAT
jgi:PAS domain S-box-containing protein